MRRPAERAWRIDAFAGHVAQREEHARRFDHHHDHHKAHGEDEQRIENRRAEVERQHKVKPAGGCHFGKGHLAHDCGKYAADQDAKQHSDVLDKAFAETGNGKD